MMTPQEVASCTFTKAVMGGYNMAAVDDFLDKLTEDYSSLHKENAALKSKLKVLADSLAEYKEMEDAMRSTLLTAQKMATNLVAEAEQKRDALVADAAGAAKQRREEIAREVAEAEAQLLQVRADVDTQIALEQQRLALAQSELRAYIQTVQSVCQKQLDLLEQLPELPAAPVAEEQPAQPSVEKEDVKEAPAETKVPEISLLDEDLEKDIQNVFAAFAQTGEREEESEETPADPFTDGESDEGDMGATRILNLDDLQFGRNYTKE